MMMSKVNLLYFSATGTTAKVVSAIGDVIGVGPKKVCDLLTNGPDGEGLRIGGDEIAVFGVPVFSGRVPDVVRVALEGVRGDNTPAIITCVYGNRDFDDALVELYDIVQANGFFVVSAGAFVAQHSIFPKVGQGRPDEQDMALIKDFARESALKIDELAFGSDRIKESSTTTSQLPIKGNRPYRDVKKIPLIPQASRLCNQCGACARQCPVQAIDKDNPRQTDRSKCISCAHCISICPMKARHFGGLIYWIACRKFEKHCAPRREPYVVYR